MGVLKSSVAAAVPADDALALLVLLALAALTLAPPSDTNRGVSKRGALGGKSGSGVPNGERSSD